MAINPSTNGTMSGRITAADANYPFGSSKDETGAGANDGTPYFKARADDIFGLQQAILEEASITPSGNADTAILSQYLEGLKKILKTGRVNYLFNPRLEINQRTFAGGVLTAGIYGFDRWKARTGGATLSRTGDLVTLSSGGIEQVIENPYLESKTITISALNGTGTITGHINGAVTTTSGPLPLTVTLDPGDSTDITIGISGTSVTFEGIQVEVGTVATGFEFRPLPQELDLCQRYFVKYTYATEDVFMLADSSTSRSLITTFPVEMRANPTLTSSITPSLGSFAGANALDRKRLGIGITSASPTTTTSTISGNIDADAEL